MDTSSTVLPTDDEVIESELDWPEWYIVLWFYLTLIVCFIASIIFIGVLCIHWRKTLLDLYSVERLPVSHRRQPPEKTFVYKAVAWCTLASGSFGCFFSVLTVMAQVSSTEGTCIFSLISSFCCAMLSKLFVYFTFGLRLHLVYKGSKYAINPNKLKCISALLMAWVIFIICLTTYQIGTIASEDGFDEITEDGAEITYNDDLIKSDDNQWAVTYDSRGAVDNVCAYDAGLTLIIGYAFFDIVCNVVYCVVFVKPIREVIRTVQGSSRNVTEKSKLERKMLFVGFKVFILSLVLLGSTLCTVILFTDWFAPASNWGPLDYLINFICLVLMTPYYPDKKYYRKLCKCCIVCCDRKGYTRKDVDQEEVDPSTTEPTQITQFSDLDSQQHSANPNSVDTMSAVRITAEQEQASMSKPVRKFIAGNKNNNAALEMVSNLNPSEEYKEQRIS